LKIKAGFSFG
jgi:hypothetical protein